MIENDNRRFYVIATSDLPAGHYAHNDFGFAVIDRTDGSLVGTDGGDPEDQLLCRDWAWVPDALNAVAKESADRIAHLESQVTELQRANTELVEAHRELAAAYVEELKARILDRESENRALKGEEGCAACWLLEIPPFGKRRIDRASGMQGHQTQREPAPLPEWLVPQLVALLPHVGHK